MSPLKRRAVEVLAMVMIGDGLVTAMRPRRHARLWRSGPPAWSRLMGVLERRPLLTAGLGAAEAAFGLWLAERQLRAQRARAV